MVAAQLAPVAVVTPVLATGHKPMTAIPHS